MNINLFQYIILFLNCFLIFSFIPSSAYLLFNPIFRLSFQGSAYLSQFLVHQLDLKVCWLFNTHYLIYLSSRNCNIVILVSSMQNKLSPQKYLFGSCPPQVLQKEIDPRISAINSWTLLTFLFQDGLLILIGAGQHNMKMKNLFFTAWLFEL